MNDPLNQLPTDPEWFRKHEEITKAAARELKCMVLVIAIQEGGKLGITMEGVPESGDIADMAKDVPTLLANLARACALQDILGRLGAKQ